ncbi:MAG TPA: hypothetical protein DCX94_08150 [Alteromonas macleodii]|nr:hypothetical protein [Alteromonas macleodii]
MSEEAKANNPDSVDSGSKSESVAELDTLLSEYDSQPTTTSVAPTTSPQTDDTSQATLEQVKQLLEEQTRQRSNQEFKENMNKTIAIMKDELGFAVSDKILSGYVDQAAKDDTRIVSAWQSMNDNPEKWKKIAKVMASDFKKGIGVPDKELTENIDAVRASVKSKTETNADDYDSKYSITNMNNLSEVEFRNLKNSYRAK